MTDERTQTKYLTREEVLDMLTAPELARVSNVEDGASLPHGEEYLDLQKLENGVQCVNGALVPTASVLPRRALSITTWHDILARLARRETAGDYDA
jgi:hypothetical protein